MLVLGESACASGTFRADDWEVFEEERPKLIPYRGRFDGFHALPASVSKTCRQALAESVHSADVIINILARHRDPGPTATILTPDALRLRHTPVWPTPSASTTARVLFGSRRC